jgi:hypothetical protein
MIDDLGFWPKFVLAVLVTWRITRLVAREDGPWDVLLRLRKSLGNGFAGKLMDCFHCLSVWVAAPLALVVATRPLDWLLVWLALSGAACLLERMGEAPVVIQPLTNNKDGEEDYGMLRTRPDEAPEHRAGDVVNRENSGRTRDSNPPA